MGPFLRGNRRQTGRGVLFPIVLCCHYYTLTLRKLPTTNEKKCCPKDAKKVPER